MADKKVVPVRFYPDTDADLITWLEDLPAGEGNDTIKAMLRAGISASQNGNERASPPASGAWMATLDPASLEAALESFLPRIREVVDASIASANLTRAGCGETLQDENEASADILSGHMLGDDDDD